MMMLSMVNIKYGVKLEQVLMQLTDDKGGFQCYLYKLNQDQSSEQSSLIGHLPNDHFNVI